MNKLTLSLTAAIALVLLSATAHADDNFANVEQSGLDNTGAVTQGPGNNNQVGTPDNVAPSAALQDGSLNIFTILQSGSANKIGTTGDGFDQTGRRNVATITQSTDGNSVGEVQQSAITGSNNAGPRNSLTVLQQGGDGNAVGRVEQIRINSGNAQPGNSAAITQGFDDGFTAGGSGNIVDLLFQNGRSNNATVVQSSNGNSLGSLLQDGNGNASKLTQRIGDGNVAGTIGQDGNNNTADLSFVGAGNGTLAGFALDGLIASELPSLFQGSAFQYGSGNGLNLTVTGDGNGFGFSQDGDGNAIAGNIVSNDNQFGVVQDGNDNVALANIVGNKNEVAIGQTPGFVVVLGIPIPNGANDNLAAANVTGSDNGISIAQSGRNNSATANVDTGDRNTIAIRQESILLGNDALVNVRQNDNLITIDQTHFSNATVGVAGSRNQIDLLQDGNNTAVVEIAALAPASGGDDNVVTATQTQTGLLGSNRLSVSIEGSNNSFAVTQTISGGGTNDADLTVFGSGNRAIVSQSKSGLGAGNSLDLDIYGDDNNRAGLSFTGTALSMAGSLAPGSIVQNGRGNAITMSVGTPSNPTSDGNLFAFSQDGNANQIIGVVQGNSNQAVVVQTGNSNFTSFTQIGNFNIIGVSQ